MRQFAGLVVSAGWAVAWRPGGLFGQVAGDPSAALWPLLAGSPFGVCLTLVLIGWLSPKSTVDRLLEALADVRGQRDALATQQAEVIPVLISVQQTMIPSLQRSAEAKEAMARELVELRREIERLVRGS